MPCKTINNNNIIIIIITEETNKETGLLDLVQF